MTFNKVFGIGLPKTGTTSLHAALTHVGLRSLHNPRDLRTQVYEGQFRFEREDWDALVNFSEHFYPQLDRSYPGSKFILTVRNEDDWLSSWQRQIEGTTGERKWSSILFENWYRPGTWYLFLEKKLSGHDIKDASIKQMRLDIFNMYRYHEGHCRHVYRTHKRNALEYFKDREDDLLVLNICDGEGWEKLCSFLEIEEVTSENFPHKIPPATRHAAH